jgi:hypothetical protein
MPIVKIGDTKVEGLGGGVYQTIDGRGLEVISASVVGSNFDFQPLVQQLIDQKDLRRIIVRNGLPGKTTRTIQYLVKGSGDITVKYASLKGGTVQTTLTLK